MDWVESGINELLALCEEYSYGFGNIEAKFIKLELIQAKNKIENSKNADQYIRALKEGENLISRLKKELARDLSSN